MPEALRAYFEDSTHQGALSHLLGGLTATIQANLPPVTVDEAADRDPILIGTRFVLVPAGRIALPIDAAMAFGSGRHETTQLCLEALEKYLKPGDTVYDIGCGSGILSLAALKLGAGRIIATDIDEPALAVARRHFPGPVFVGSADCFPALSADIVLSNITGKVNDHIAADLKRIVKTTGIVIASGFTTETAPTSMQPRERLVLGHWECWICHPAQLPDFYSGTDQNQHKSQWWI